MMNTLDFVKHKYQNALLEFSKYLKVKELMPFQYNRAVENLRHWNSLLALCIVHKSELENEDDTNEH